MIPMTIGTEERPLHAVLTAAAGKRQRRAVVFCPPFAEEYARTHRAGRLLAQRLASAGLDALRFDYFGTGDSDGEDEEFNLEGAVQDALTAIDEARDLGKVRHLTLVGMRHGALVALRAASRSRGVDRVVLWDPVVVDLPDAPLAIDVLMLVSADTPDHERLRLRIAELGARVTFEDLRCDAPWEPVGEDGIGVAPVAALARIAGWTP